MSQKTTNVIIAAVTGAAAGTMIALVSPAKNSVTKKVNSFARTTSHLLSTAGTVFLNLSDMIG